MAAKYDNVIVFGPTGEVGGHTALEASKRGAKVWLALRDPSKPITVIPADVEKAGNFTRLQADLLDPESVRRAIKESGAKAAYFYLAHGTDDHMRGTVKALKDSGVENIVFLSTGSLSKYSTDLPTISPEEFIPYSHAQVEIAVEELGFPHFTALRPFAFASNHFKLFLDRSVKPPRVKTAHPEGLVDNIVPDDIGAVGAAVLVDRPSDGKEVIYIHGPKIRTVEESWAVIKKVTGRDDIDTTPITDEEFLEGLKKSMPPALAHYLARNYATTRDWKTWYPEPLRISAVENIKKYTGREATEFEDYIATHKAQWQAA